MSTLSKLTFFAEHLIKESSDFIGITDADGGIIDYNPSALKAFGYSLEELRNLDFRVLYESEEDYNLVVKSLDETGAFSGEVRNRHKNGQVFTCHLSANVLYDEHGVMIGRIGVSRDITEQKKILEELERQNARNQELILELENLSKIATTVMNGIVITDPEGRIKWCNESFVRITGYSMTDMIGFRPSELFRIPHFYQETFDEFIKQGTVNLSTIQVPHYRKNGELYWIVVESTPVMNDKGEITEIIEVCTEITDQKKAEMALVESEQNFRQISETIDDVFFLYNLFDKKYDYVSGNAKSILGVDPEFFYDGGSFITSFVHEEDRHMIRKGLMDLVNGKTVDIEYRIVIDGQEKWMHERAFPIRDEQNNIIKGSGIISDITEVKRAKEVIDAQNQNITESINYAQHIQQSTLQSEEDVSTIFPNSFLYYQPMGKLSGDFYIADSTRSNDGKKFSVFVVADCTGHGIPGAILSILCISLVKQSLRNPDVSSPAEALEYVRTQLAKLFYARDDDQLTIKDGMDIGFGVVDEENHTITYAGANLNVHILRNDEWIELRGIKQHVGYSETQMPFENVDFDYQKGDHLFLFTDGFVDQFGGDQNKKYMKRKLMDFLESIQSEPMHIQRHMLEMEFLSWKGNEEQTDDLCCFGLRLD